MISVVIPTCQRPELLARCLDCLRPGAQELEFDKYEVVVSDDGRNTVEEMLSARYPWVQWIAGPRRGPAANRNCGANRAIGEWIAYVDDDCIPNRSWLAAYVSAITPNCVVYEGKTTCAAGITSPLMCAPVNLTGGYLWSCNFMILKSAFEELGGFDERFPYAGMEDIDLRERLKLDGIQFRFVSDAEVDHPPRRDPPILQSARSRESICYFWYKSGNRGCFSLRFPFDFVNSNARRILLRHPLGADSIVVACRSIAELALVLPRLPYWELKYRWRFPQRQIVAANCKASVKTF
jgi:GT2 family glycosyltransferase